MDGSLSDHLAELALSGVAGALAAYFAAVKRYGKSHRNTRRRVSRLERRTAHHDQLYRDINRRSAVMLELLASIANKLGIQHRMTDALTTLIREASEEESHEPPAQHPDQ